MTQEEKDLFLYNCKRLRLINNDISQTEMAQALGITRMTYINWENGIVTLDNLSRVANILHCNIGDFFKPKELPNGKI